MVALYALSKVKRKIDIFASKKYISKKYISLNRNNDEKG